MPVPPGKHTLSVRFTPTGKNLKPDYFSGDVVLAVDGRRVAELKNIKSGMQYSSMTGYGLVIGRNIGTPVSHEYKAPFSFTGTLNKVTVELK
jgi:arylsulfatase